MNEQKNQEISKSLKQPKDEKLSISNNINVTINGKPILNTNDDNINVNEKQNDEQNYITHFEVPSIEHLNIFEKDYNPNFFGKDISGRDVVVNISRLDYDLDTCTSKGSKNSKNKSDYQKVRMVSVITETEEGEKNESKKITVEKNNSDVISEKNKSNINGKNNEIDNSKTNVVEVKEKNNNVNNIKDENFKYYNSNKRNLFKICLNKYFLLFVFIIIIVTILLFLLYIFIQILI